MTEFEHLQETKPVRPKAIFFSIFLVSIILGLLGWYGGGIMHSGFTFSIVTGFLLILHIVVILYVLILAMFHTNYHYFVPYWEGYSDKEWNKQLNAGTRR